MDRYYHRNDVPKNILNRGGSLTDPLMFSLVESGKTQDRTRELEENRLENFTPDYDGLKAVHKFIFQDTYEWAGKTRAEEVTIQGQTFTPEPTDTWTRRGQDGEITAFFQGSKELQTEAPIQINRHAPLFQAAAGQGKLDIPKFAELAADMIEDMNYAHPFADGNGRAMRGFVVQLGRSHGINIDLSTSTKEHWIRASIMSAEAMPQTMISLIEKAASEMTQEQKLQSEMSSVKFDAAVRLEEQRGIFDRVKSAIGLVSDTPSKEIGATPEKASLGEEAKMVENSGVGLGIQSPGQQSALNTAEQMKQEIGEDILGSFQSVQNGAAPIESLRATMTTAYQASIDNSIGDFAFYGPNAPKELGAAAALNPKLTAELMTAQAAVDTINQVQPALRADKPKDISQEQMQNLKTSSQNNVYGDVFLQAAARVSPTFMRFYIQTAGLIAPLVPSVETPERLSNEQIDTSLMKGDELKTATAKLEASIGSIYQNPDMAFKKAMDLAKNPDLNPADLRNNIFQKPEVLGALKPLKKGLFGRVEQEAIDSAICDVKNDAKQVSAILQQGRKEARRVEQDVSKKISVSIPLPSKELSQALEDFERNPDLKNFGKGYDVEKLYTEGQRLLDQTGVITRISGKHGFGIKPEALENIKKLKSTVQRLQEKQLSLTKTLGKVIAPKLGPKL